jgi:RHS repeat-associated protein
MDGTTQIYGAYGERAGSSDHSSSAFSGEVPEASTGWYVLGERLYSPTLRRFIGPDRASPFERGGVNRYAYCGGDPISRVDPSGNTWLRWLGTSQGLTGSPGAARTVTAGNQNSEASAFPGMLNSTAAAVADTLSITAAIDSVALATSARPKAEGLFGRVAMSTGTTSGGSALPAARKGPPQTRFLGRHNADARSPAGQAKPARQVTVLTGNQIPAERLTTTRPSGRRRLTRNWTDLAHTRNSETSIIAADTTIKGSHLIEVLDLVKQAGINKVNVYTGGHGDEHGLNWNRRGDRYPDLADSTFAAQDAALQMQARKRGVKLNLINLNDITLSQFEKRLAEDGVHIIAHCFGVADPAVMNALNLSHVFVYDSPPP